MHWDIDTVLRRSSANRERKKNGVKEETEKEKQQKKVKKLEPLIFNL